MFVWKTQLAEEHMKYYRIKYANLEFNLEQLLKGETMLRGDANNNGGLDIRDLVSIIEFIVNGTECPSMRNADANQDGVVNIQDLVWVIKAIVG